MAKDSKRRSPDVYVDNLSIQVRQPVFVNLATAKVRGSDQRTNLVKMTMQMLQMLCPTTLATSSFNATIVMCGNMVAAWA